MKLAHRFELDSLEYTDALETLIASSGGDQCAQRLLTTLMQSLPSGASAVDWGAGMGYMSRILLQRFETVYAVEPDRNRREELARNCPGAVAIDGTITSFVPPAPVQLGLISHVFYHVPDHKWGAYTIRAANHLSDDGVLLVTLQAPESPCARMLAHFGAPPFDLQQSLADVLRTHTEFDFTWSHGHSRVRTESFEDTLKIARFVLSDREEDAYSRLVTEDEFCAYVRTHFWDEVQGEGGWKVSLDYCVVRRNPLLADVYEGCQ